MFIPGKRARRPEAGASRESGASFFTLQAVGFQRWEELPGAKEVEVVSKGHRQAAGGEDRSAATGRVPPAL